MASFALNADPKALSAEGTLFNSTSPAPTRIFVSQSEICSRFVLPSYSVGAPAPGAGGAVIVFGIPNKKPPSAPTSAAASATNTAHANTIHDFSAHE